MADFSNINLALNIGTNAAPYWAHIGAGDTELRWSDHVLSNVTTFREDWPIFQSPITTVGLDYAYAYLDESSGYPLFSDSDLSVGLPGEPFSISNFLWGRWEWSSDGTFASAPILTAYTTTSHDTPTRGDGSLLGGSIDTRVSLLTPKRSYLKCQAFGNETRGQGNGTFPAGSPTSGPSLAPVVTDGTTGALTPNAGDWLTTWQGLQGSTDYVQCRFTPTALSAYSWNIILRLFTGPYLNPGFHTPILALSYVHT